MELIVANLSSLIGNLSITTDYIPATLLVSALFVAFTIFVVRADFYRAAGLLTFALAIAIFFSVGHDLHSHAPRLIELHRELLNGSFDLFSYVKDVALPVFYFYSPTFYLIAVPFDQIGFTAATSIQLVAALFFVTMALCTRAFLRDLITTHSESTGNPKHLAGLLTIFFITANYVFLNFALRNAYPEAATYALVPAILLSLRSKSALIPVALITLQISLHPPVFPQAALATFIAHLATMDRPIRNETARLFQIMLAALVLSSPSWLWAFLHRSMIMGPEALPIHFEDTFLSFSALLSLTDYRVPGPYILLALAALALNVRALRGRAGLLFGAAIVVLLAQMIPMRSFVQHIPFIDLGLFIWRWMFVVVLLTVLALCLAWSFKVGHWFWKALACAAGAQALFLGGNEMLPSLPDSFLDAEISTADKSAQTWGFAEYYPNYPSNPLDCDILKRTGHRLVRFQDALIGSVTMRQSIAVNTAPLAGLTYMVNGSAAETSACGEFLLIHHPEPGALADFKIEKDTVHTFPELRLLPPALALFLLILGLLRTGRRTQTDT